jgi:hypothetical protein
MKTIRALYAEGRGVTDSQRSHFYSKIESRLRSGSGIARYQAYEALTELWRSYDAGGMSIGRTLRAGLLEKVLSSKTDEDHKKTCLSVLCGLYHDLDAVRGWSERSVEHFSDDLLSDRILIATAMFALGLEDQVADMREWPEEKIRKLVTG